MKNLFELGADFSDLQLWAVGCSVGPKGYVSFEGEQAREVSAHEASRIATLPGRLRILCGLIFHIPVIQRKIISRTTQLLADVIL